MPTSRAFKECVQGFRIVLVDEFRTTMVHLGDGRAMKQVWSRRDHATVRGLMGVAPPPASSSTTTQMLLKTFVGAWL